MVIFTSDNGPNVGTTTDQIRKAEASGEKRPSFGKGGHRVPFILFWKERFEGGRINRNLFTLTDLFATFASLVGEPLKPSEAQDSLDSLAYWEVPEKKDSRARYFFCHLGPPYGNDAIAVRKGSKKLIAEGGLARPWTMEGTRGSAKSVILYDLKKNPQEQGDFSNSETEKEAKEMSHDLLKIHNQGHTRELEAEDNGNLIWMMAGTT